MSEIKTVTVLDIQRCALNDGPGIRTTVFLKGCPLNCLWCHNPESIPSYKELAFYIDKCISCGACVDACPNNVHLIQDNKHTLNRNDCNLSGACVDVCPTDALKFAGTEMTVNEIINEVEKDCAFYNESGGGLTISGGEPLHYSNFIEDLLKEAQNRDINTCLDTTLFASQKTIDKILPYVNYFLIDYKASDEHKHTKLTGQSNNIIIENINYLYNKAAKILFRCPLIPGLNDQPKHLLAIAELENKYPNIEGVEIMPYHNTANSKYERYGYSNPLPNKQSTSDDTKKEWLKFFEDQGCKKIFISE